jgi:hypothetical protein
VVYLIVLFLLGVSYIFFVLLLVLYYLSIVYSDYSNKEMAVIKVNAEYKQLLVGMKCQNDNGLCLIQGNLVNCSIIKMLNQSD